jgi:glycine/D-amino acid oxidase-like deaminating enzyme
MTRILILGAGFGGISAALTLRQELGDAHEVVVVDQGPSFMMGLSKLWALDGRRPIAAGRRAIAGLEDHHRQEETARLVLGRSLSVRQTEELVRRLREPKPKADAPKRPTDPDLERVEEDLRRSLGTKVSLARTRRGGRIVIEYYSDEELGRLYERLTGAKP